MKYLVLIIAASLSIISCSSDLGKLESSSADDQMTIRLSATKVIADPMKVKLELEFEGKTYDAEFEVYSDELSENTVSFDWQKDYKCTITFDEWDESPKKIFVGLQNGGLLIKSLGN